MYHYFTFNYMLLRVDSNANFTQAPSPHRLTLFDISMLLLFALDISYRALLYTCLDAAHLMPGRPFTEKALRDTQQITLQSHFHSPLAIAIRAGALLHDDAQACSAAQARSSAESYFR